MSSVGARVSNLSSVGFFSDKNVSMVGFMQAPLPPAIPPQFPPLSPPRAQLSSYKDSAGHPALAPLCTASR